MSESASSSTLWATSQILGLVFIEGMDALRYPDNEGNPNGNMRRALILVAVLALVAGTSTLLYTSRNYRMESEEAAANNRDTEVHEGSHVELDNKAMEA